MKKYLESVLNRYVIATLDNPTNYLIFKDDKISFTKHISRCTKTASKVTARTIVQEFYAYTGMTDIELVILPIEINYEIISEETGDEIGELLS